MARRKTYAANVTRLLGAAAVFLGGVVIGFNPNGWHPALVHLAAGTT